MGWAGPGSVHDERRCRGVARRTGERCKKAAIKGHHFCPSHGGSLPTVRKSAKERLLELVDPALAALHKVLSDESADDAVKVRAALGILDRTGHGPGQKIEIGTADKWGSLLEDAFSGVDRDLPPGDDRPALDSGGGEPKHTWEDVDTEQRQLQAKAWRQYDQEDGEPWATRFNPYDGRTVRGEVVEDPEPPTYGRDGTESDRKRG